MRILARAPVHQRRSATLVIPALWAVGGILAGHALTYALLFPDAHVHDAVLAGSGHGWLAWLWPTALVALLVAVVLGLLSRTSAAGARGIRFVALATVQIGLFVTLELSERMATGVADRALLHLLLEDGLASILVVGVLVQLVCAWFASAASRLVERFAARVRPQARPRPAAGRISIGPLRDLPRSAPVGLIVIRGPPAPAIA